MYIPKAFEQQDFDEMHSLIRQNPFATLVTNTDAGLVANHLPFLLREDGSEYGILVGHLARANPIWQDYKPEQSVLIIFQGVNAYISPSWYPSKQENGKAVPTWNYAVVHASGLMQINEDGIWLRELLDELTNTHEAQFEKPWAVADAPADYIEKLSGAIVGIEIPVSTLIGKWKLSQNQPEQNRRGVVDGLQESSHLNAREMANLVDR